MKILPLISIFQLLVLMSLKGQPLEVNKYILSPFGSPVSEIDWIGTAKDASGNLVTTGNTFISADITAVLVTKQDSTGALLWQTSFYPSTALISKNYGIGVVMDAQSNIYVAAASKTGTNGNFDYLILKYSGAGDWQWTKTIDGTDHLDDIPAAIALNNSGQLFITGTSFSASSLTDFMTVRIDTATGSLSWTMRYDYQNQYEAALDISFDLSDNPVITGLSSSNLASAGIATLKYDKSSGGLDSESHYSGGSADITQPKALARDQWGNLYIAGDNSSDGTQDIVLLKLDADLNFAWATTYDYQGEYESVNGLTTDASGNIFLTGSSKVNDNFTDLLVLMYDSTGSFKWTQRRKAEQQKEQVVGKQIKVLPDNKIYVLGERQFDDRRNILLIKLDPEGTFIRENRHTSDCLQGDDTALHFETYPAQKSTVVLAKSVQDDESLYYNLRFEEFERNPAIHSDSLDIPICKKSEIIIRFNPAYVIQNKVDDLDINYGSFGDFLDTSLIVPLERTLPLGDHKLIRIFTRLHTTDTLSISRSEESVRIPAFWSTFVLTMPESSLSAILDICTGLESLTPYVLYAHPNYIPNAANNCPNDAPEDDFYAAQASLYPDPDFPVSGDPDINVEPAWGCSVGNPAIKVGVYDSRITYKHEDFEYNAGTGFSAVKGGWDFGTNTCLTCPGGSTSTSSHGTEVAGIIGAVRDNDIGVAGIAGGAWNGTPGSEGVSLYSMIVLGSANDIDGLFTPDLKYLADAIVTGASSSNDPCCSVYPEACFQLDIMNHSYTFSNASPFSNTQLVEDAVHYAFRNHIVTVAARGNSGNENILYPACYDDDWVINVPATNCSGLERLITSSFGHNVDVGAPGCQSIIYTTGVGTTSYINFQKTSAAAPHVSGVAGLLLSAGDIPGNIGTGAALAPEDVEWVLQLSARDIFDPNYDIETGYGLLDAGQALADLTMCSHYHFGTSNLTPSWQTDLMEEDVVVQFNEPYTAPGGYVFEKNTNYKADVYKITGTFAHGLSEVVEASWVRPSSCNTFDYYTSSGVVNYIEPHEMAILSTISSASAELFGYTYRIKDSGGNFLAYAPFDPAVPANTRMAYTLRTCGIVSTSESTSANNFGLSVYPNPASDRHRIAVSDANNEILQITLFDLNGRQLHNLSQKAGDSPIGSSVEVPINHLLPGIYFYRIVSKFGVQYVNFIKI